MELDYPQLTDEQFKKFSRMLFELSGIKLHDHKKYLLIHRLSKYVGPSKKYPGFEQYYQALQDDESGKMVSDFLNVLTTNFTFFFREPVHFEFLREYLEKARETEDFIRIWSAACSSGEEPYSMAITLKQALNDPAAYDTKILATDISQKMLHLAENGVYHYTKVRGHLEDKLLKEYFKFDKENNDFIVEPSIKNLVSFRYLNLLEAFPFKKLFDVVFLRNVLIYFENTEKEYIINKIGDYIKPGGYLILGLSESLVGLQHRFKINRNSIYQKI
jgi:chemotaxis protein methyltransferase CheR